MRQVGLALRANGEEYAAAFGPPGFVRRHHRNARNWPPSRISSTVFWRRTERFTVRTTRRSVYRPPSRRIWLHGQRTIVKDYVRERCLRRRMFEPLSRSGPCSSGLEADAIIAGVKYRAHFFVMTLAFVAAYPVATTEAWLDGHSYMSFVGFGGASIDSIRQRQVLLSPITSDGTLQRTADVQRAAVRLPLRHRYGSRQG